MDKECEYNVPRIIKITDSFGNTIHLNEIEKLLLHSWLLYEDHKNNLQPGDTLDIEIEIDPSFDPSSYTIEWDINGKIINEYNNKTKIAFGIEVKHVGVNFSVGCFIISNKKWHKNNIWDDCITIRYKVLPPLNDH